MLLENHKEQFISKNFKKFISKFSFNIRIIDGHHYLKDPKLAFQKRLSIKRILTYLKIRYQNQNFKECLFFLFWVSFLCVFAFVCVYACLCGCMFVCAMCVFFPVKKERKGIVLGELNHLNVRQKRQCAKTVRNN